MSGKGSVPRPFSVSADEFAASWDLIFKKGKEPEDNVDSNEKDSDDSEQK